MSTGNIILHKIYRRARVHTFWKQRKWKKFQNSTKNKRKKKRKRLAKQKANYPRWMYLRYMKWFEVYLFFFVSQCDMLNLPCIFRSLEMFYCSRISHPLQSKFLILSNFRWRASEWAKVCSNLYNSFVLYPQVLYKKRPTFKWSVSHWAQHAYTHTVTFILEQFQFTKLCFAYSFHVICIHVLLSKTKITIQIWNNREQQQQHQRSASTIRPTTYWIIRN